MMGLRLAVISANWPEYDATAAGLRMHELIDLFSQWGYETHYATTAQQNEFHSKSLKDKGVEVHPIELNSDSFDQWVKQLDPHVVLFDRYVVEEQFGWRLKKAVPSAFVILDTEDLHSLRVSRHLAHREGIEWSTSYWKAQDITKRELASIYRSDLSLIISKVEYDYLIDTFQLSEDLLSFLPFIPKASTKELLGFEERKDFVFIGNGMHAPNRDAIDYLKKEVWPLIRKALKKSSLHIYGAYLPQSTLNYHNPKEGFLVHGKTDDANEVMRTARVNLAPIRYGAGIKGKVVQSILQSTPTVATPIATEGIEGLQSSSEDPHLLAQAAIRLYTDSQQWNREAEHYSRLAKKLVDTNKYICTFKSRLDELMPKLAQHREQNFIGQLLTHHQMKSTEYFSKWIQEKNKT